MRQVFDDEGIMLGWFVLMPGDYVLFKKRPVEEIAADRALIGDLFKRVQAAARTGGK